MGMDEGYYFIHGQLDNHSPLFVNIKAPAINQVLL